ncbi:Uncharacterised protein [Serratia rubidaea]|nr:Uncharacterised protein [Serratia rubidaea]
MIVSSGNLRDGSQWLARELTRLEQLNRPLTIDEFFKWSEEGLFIKKIFKKYGNFMLGLHILNPDHEHCNHELLRYIENALSRHANVISGGTYGVVDNAYLLAINVLFTISREADEL